MTNGRRNKIKGVGRIAHCVLKRLPGKLTGFAGGCTSLYKDSFNWGSTVSYEARQSARLLVHGRDASVLRCRNHLYITMIANEVSNGN